MGSIQCIEGNVLHQNHEEQQARVMENWRRCMLGAASVRLSYYLSCV